MKRRSRLPAAVGFAFAALALLALFEFTSIDMDVQRALYDPANGGFRWRREPGLEFWGHIQVRRALYLLPIAALFGWAGNLFRARRSVGGEQARARRDARRWRYLLVALLVAPTSVSIVKQWTDRPCPWDVVDFGGAQRRYGLFEAAPAQGRHLACFPAGHASGGFALFAIALAGGVPGLRRSRRSTIAWAGAALALGTLLGAVRVVQGAHFVSHVLWSAWLVFLVQWLLAQWMLRRSRQTFALRAGTAAQRSAGSGRARVRRAAEA